MSETEVKVVLVEDDPMVLQVNRQFIERVPGYKVIAEAVNGVEGIKKIKVKNPDLVILDIYLPKQDGLSTIKEIRTQDVDVDIIVITAANDRKTIRKMLHYGIEDYIIKPFNFERIKKTLEQYRIKRASFKQKEEFSQSALDESLFHDKETHLEKEEEILPKGLNHVTLKQITNYMLQQEGAKSAEEVAEGVGLARVTARRYLDYLEKNGMIKIDLQYGSVGRPVKKYARN
ncbi:response regulator [Salirhabdus salicampi]|uniref:response regulator n=1 Tax=Salirhabdus salicampi TaxID=476102 RepID=UPI0020C53922|nr:response regulator [Salirhabdus salicampi]MCP8615624.1 response regulator [Salirhabdus salicampi]